MSFEWPPATLLTRCSMDKAFTDSFQCCASWNDLVTHRRRSSAGSEEGSSPSVRLSSLQNQMGHDPGQFFGV